MATKKINPAETYQKMLAISADLELLTRRYEYLRDYVKLQLSEGRENVALTYWEPQKEP